MDCLSHLFKISTTKLFKQRYKRHQGKGWTDGDLGPFGRRPAPGGEGNCELSAGFAAQLDAALQLTRQDVDQLQTQRLGFAVVEIADDDTHVVVTDLNMPEVDGFEVMRQVTANSPEVKIIVLSGASQETEQKAIEMGAVRTLSKPVQGIELVDIINELVA